jgi:hypothetical protein
VASHPRALTTGGVGDTLGSMQPLRAYVQNGRIVIDDPATDLPEGTELHLVPVEDDGDDLDEEERAALHASLDRASDDEEAGRMVDAQEFLQSRRGRRENSHP